MCVCVTVLALVGLSDIRSTCSKCDFYTPREVESMCLSTSRFLKLREVPANDHFHDLWRQLMLGTGTALREKKQPVSTETAVW